MFVSTVKSESQEATLQHLKNQIDIAAIDPATIARYNKSVLIAVDRFPNISMTGKHLAG